MKVGCPGQGGVLGMWPSAAEGKSFSQLSAANISADAGMKGPCRSGQNMMPPSMVFVTVPRGQQPLPSREIRLDSELVTSF